jgi:hypothetical protein
VLFRSEVVLATILYGVAEVRDEAALRVLN